MHTLKSQDSEKINSALRNCTIAINKTRPSLNTDDKSTCCNVQLFCKDLTENLPWFLSFIFFVRLLVHSIQWKSKTLIPDNKNRICHASIEINLESIYSRLVFNLLFLFTCINFLSREGNIHMHSSTSEDLADTCTQTQRHRGGDTDLELLHGWFLSPGCRKPKPST